jgi:TraK protein
MIKKYFVGASLLISSFYPLFGIIIQEIDTTIPLKCVFSNIHQNRIVVQNGRVEKVIFIDDSIAMRMEEESGQAFVCAINPTSRESVISIVTDKGQVQDLEIRFEDRASEVVILEEPCSKKNSDSTHNIGEQITQILSGQTPEGFYCIDGEEKLPPIRSCLERSVISIFEGYTETIRLERLTNTGCCKLRFSERDLCSSSTQWVYILKNALTSREETLAIISERREI